MTFRASGIEDLSRCFGKARLEAQCPPGASSAEATFGTNVHAGLSGSLPPGAHLTQDEKDCVIRLAQMRDDTLTEWNPHFAPMHSVWNPERLHCNNLSGTPDEYHLSKNRAFVIDFKSLPHGDHVESASNLQLRSYALLVKEKHPEIKSITVAILQDGHRPKTCVYNEDDLRTAREEIFAIIEAAEKPDAPLTPGEKQCRWCRAILICPAVRSEFETLNELARD